MDALTLRGSAATDRGPVRKTNEDWFVCDETSASSSWRTAWAARGRRSGARLPSKSIDELHPAIARGPPILLAVRHRPDAVVQRQPAQDRRAPGQPARSIASPRTTTTTPAWARRSSAALVLTATDRRARRRQPPVLSATARARPADAGRFVGRDRPRQQDARGASRRAAPDAPRADQCARRARRHARSICWNARVAAGRDPAAVQRRPARLGASTTALRALMASKQATAGARADAGAARRSSAAAATTSPRWWRGAAQ